MMPFDLLEEEIVRQHRFDMTRIQLNHIPFESSGIPPSLLLPEMIELPTYILGNIRG